MAWSGVDDEKMQDFCGFLSQKRSQNRSQNSFHSRENGNESNQWVSDFWG
jgi:hypothetical protein